VGIKEVKRQANIRKWTAVFSDRNASGLTVRQYCHEHGITKDQYYYWLKVVRTTAIELAEQQNALVEIQTAPNDEPLIMTSEDRSEPPSCTPCIRIQNRETLIHVDGSAPASLVRAIMEVMQNA